MNFKQLYTQAGNASLVNDPALAKQAVNDAIREMIQECGWNYTKTPLTNLTSGVWEYPMTNWLPGTPGQERLPLKVQYVMYFPAGQQGDMLNIATLQEVIERHWSSMGSSASDRVYAIGDLNTMLFDPTPAAGDQIIMYYSADIDDYTNDTDIPKEVPSYLHRHIVFMAARNLAIVNNAQMVMELEPLAQLALTACRQFANLRKSRRPMRARVGSTRGGPRSDNSQYFTGDG